MIMMMSSDDDDGDNDDDDDDDDDDGKGVDHCCFFAGIFKSTQRITKSKARKINFCPYLIEMLPLFSRNL